MTIQKFQCPSCGASLDDPGIGTTLRCPYCSGSVVIPAQLIAARNAMPSPAIKAKDVFSTEENWAVGDRVFAYWDADGYYYPATVTGVEGRDISVRYDDGAEDSGDGDYAVGYELYVDDEIECKWSGDGMYYWAQVVEVKSDQIKVEFEDGVQEWTNLGNVRLWFEEDDE